MGGGAPVALIGLLGLDDGRIILAVDADEDSRLLAEGEDLLQLITVLDHVADVLIGGEELDDLHPKLLQFGKLFSEGRPQLIDPLVEGVVDGHRRSHLFDAALGAGGQRPLLVIVCKIDDRRHPPIGGGFAPLFKGVRGDGPPTLQVVVGVRIDDAGEDAQSFGVDDLTPLAYRAFIDFIGDAHHCAVLDEEVGVARPFGIDNKSVLNQQSAHKNKIPHSEQTAK